ncbi:unnamed protein product, partial [Ascophyllum nodosum]
NDTLRELIQISEKLQLAWTNRIVFFDPTITLPLSSVYPRSGSPCRTEPCSTFCFARAYGGGRNV